MARNKAPELHDGWEYDDAPQLKPGKGANHASDHAKAAANGHFMNQGKKKYYNLIRVRGA